MGVAESTALVSSERAADYLLGDFRGAGRPGGGLDGRVASSNFVFRASKSLCPTTRASSSASSEIGIACATELRAARTKSSSSPKTLRQPATTEAMGLRRKGEILVGVGSFRIAR